MTGIPFNADWSVKPKVSGFTDLMGKDTAARPVTLPHDAILSLPRSATDSEGPSTG
ncbi:hypothetical protein [Streptomyces acidiscabies]|uniref:Uncharacterized protein n=1 Tax=Streptomyces acidiscabies TaxID=42234 RepID=A0AAP6BKT7_9ACTN|nr:hypothetical protein [Streptomyces acidiscabies]MBZ3917703.1 hypothetical protein [Streptomyces acidiscabies]MDX2966644.1 hypothetical protein [Streptomyces acidiscabies]MDX3025172.1 hypothetical protein [Streptomyces acidiscabies]MDX3796614.1 hypothetical protein [Streptomyces acidiscabies]GAV39852.1 hypothetical protein Saa2_02739 [Streptomyces acidiscabies]